MRERLVFSAGTVFILALAGCAPERQSADRVRYLDSEPDTGTRVTRLLATKSHLRMDDGRDEGDFVLFDRAAGIVYSVAHGVRNVTVVEKTQIAVMPPGVFETRVEGLGMPEAPQVGDRVPVLQRFFVNDQVCAEVAAVPVLPGLVQALREFQNVLATQQAALYRDVPESTLNDCDLANYVLRPEETLRHGLPLRQRLADGRVRELSDYASEVEVSRALFAVPPDYPNSGLIPESGEFQIAIVSNLPSRQRSALPDSYQSPST